MALEIKDVRAEMPNYEQYKDWQRDGDIVGITIHHSATADRSTGAPLGTAETFFTYHVSVRGWVHGGYNYVITGKGEIEYALDDKIAAYHAGFKDPENAEGLEFGQYWNNHYLAICLAGWFMNRRIYRDSFGTMRPIPDNDVTPTESQRQALFALIQHLREKYNIPVENVRGHRELAGNITTCPGSNVGLADLRAALRAADEAARQPDPAPTDDVPTAVEPGQHVLLLPDTDKYFQSALAYVWKFLPDVSFSIDEARGRWDYVTAVGGRDQISDSQLAHLRRGGAKLVQRIPGDPAGAQLVLDDLVAKTMRFLEAPLDDGPEPQKPDVKMYTVQPGDTLSAIARQMYGKAHLWRIIFEANQDTLSDPSKIRPGQQLKIPPEPTT